MVRSLIPLAATIALLVPMRLSAQAQTPDALFARAVELHQKDDLDGAVRAYQEVLRAQPDNLAALSNLGAVYARLGRLGEAIEHYTRALQLDSGNAEIRFNLGLAYYKAARIPSAAAEFAKVVASRPDHKSAVLLLADCYLSMAEHKKVVELLEPLQEKAGEDRAFLYLLGTALIRDGQPDKGQALVDRILRQGDSAEAHMLLGTAQMMARDYPGALKEFARAVELNASLPSVNSYYGRMVLATGNRDEAVKAFHRELAINPNDYDSNLYLGMLLKQDRKYAEAVPYLARALQIRPGAPDARYQLGSLYVSTGKIEEARQILEELVKQAPSFTEAHVSLATVYYRLKRKEDGDRHRAIVARLNAEAQARSPAAKAEQQAYRGDSLLPADPEAASAAAPVPTSESLVPQPAEPRGTKAAPAPKTAPPDFDSLAARAAVARQAERIEEAIELYEQALKLRADWAEGWWLLGGLYYSSQRYATAADAFRRLTDIRPNAGTAWAMRGVCEFQMGAHQTALEHLQRATSLGLLEDKSLTSLARYHLAILLSRYGKPEAATPILYAVARDQGNTEALLLALGIAALHLPILPADVPPEKKDLVLRAGRSHYYSAMREQAKARQEAEQLTVSYPDTPGVHYNFGVMLLLEGTDPAVEEFQKELKVSPGHVNAMLQIAFAYIRKRDYPPGLPYAEKAARLAPDSFVARNALGRILLETGNVERSIRELEAGVKLEPGSPETRFVLARAYLRAGRKEDAARERAEFERLDKARQNLQSP